MYQEWGGGKPGKLQTSERVIMSTDSVTVPQTGHICMLLNTKEGSNDTSMAATFQCTVLMAALIQGIS